MTPEAALALLHDNGFDGWGTGGGRFIRINDLAQRHAHGGPLSKRETKEWHRLEHEQYALLVAAFA